MLDKPKIPLSWGREFTLRESGKNKATCNVTDEDARGRRLLFEYRIEIAGGVNVLENQ